MSVCNSHGYHSKMQHLCICNGDSPFDITVRCRINASVMGISLLIVWVNREAQTRFKQAVSLRKKVRHLMVVFSKDKVDLSISPIKT